MGVVNGDWGGMSGLISGDLFARAVDLHDEGAREFAFPSTVAREVFDSLISAKCSILGGDLWKRVDGGFVVGQEAWYDGGYGYVRQRWESFYDLFSGEESYFSFVFRGPLR
ncbi:hypothetical protein [Nocardiopsis ganjiahuensis]|uniref:hypothetical protein n=1 Tax=Nocardiopsis ganjiahuensis TaxID=239984 RepID=UPI0012689F81|nr:hypothetical protein [Nocardiopsis ganjiahuensis]